MAWQRTQSGSKGRELIITLSELAEDASSKVLLMSDVGPGLHMELLAIRVELTTTVDVGNRLLEMRLEAASDDDVLWDAIVPNNSLAASMNQTWQAAVGLDETITTPQYMDLPPGLYIHPGQKLVIEDQAAIAAAADDMIVHVIGRLIN